MRVIKPNENNPLDVLSIQDGFSVFLGGSIEMGKAEPWQDELIARFDSYPDSLIFLNPRRDDWDSSWVQDPSPGTEFYKQVDWEMDAQGCSDLLLYYFADGTISPITLLELGAYASPDDAMVRVTPGYERFGNVVMYAERHDIQRCETMDEVQEWIDREYFTQYDDMRR